MNEKEYKVMRHAIQLKEPRIKNITCNHTDISRPISGNIKVDLSINYKTELANQSTIIGFCKLDYRMSSDDTSDSLLTMSIDVYAPFENTGKLDFEDFKAGVESLCVPLLLPFIKANTSLLTSMLRLPPLDIPTIDILKSISANKE